MTNKNVADKVPVREALKLNAKAFLIWWQHYPLIFVSSAIYAVVNALTPYVGIYLSAQIINELAGARELERLSRLVVVTLASTALLTLFKAALERWKNSAHAGRYYRQEKIFADKLLAMDFCSVDDPHTHDLRSQIRQNSSWGGWGLGKLFEYTEGLLTALMKIIGAAALSISLFTLRVPASAGTLSRLNHPIFIVLIIAIMFAVTFLAPVLSNQANSYWTRSADGAREANRRFSFYGFMAYDHDRALDIRMYRQDILCRQNFHQDHVFGPRGKLARYARGPMGALSALSAAVSHVFTGIVYVFVCLKAWGGAFGVGSVTQYISAITSFSGGVASLISTLGDMQNNAAFLRETFELLDTPNDMYQGSLTVEKRSDRHYEIEFRDVSFKYPTSDIYALRHVSMKFKIGSRLAVVGENGSGKTTFIKLLCRLYDPTEGEILLNGINIKKYDYNEYLSVFSVVFQDFKLFAYPLGQNVATTMDYDQARVEECLKEAGFGDRLREMPAGVATCLYKDFDEKGVEVSGGEAQKIAIARALYKDAPFIVLDEPTAALDPVAEAEIYAKFNEIVSDKTAIYISHRLSSCRFCDEILVFDQGQVVQQGSHDQLVADESGKYRELWVAQAQYYADDRMETGALREPVVATS